MAKKSKTNHNDYRKELTARYMKLRLELRTKSKDIKLSQEEREEARRELGKLPKNSNPNRVRNRCSQTGRPRAYMRKFGLCRIKFREMAHAGEIPGVTKSSW